MKAWDPTGQMLRNYRVRSGLDDAAAAFDAGIVGTIAPRIGTPITVPTFLSLGRYDERIS